MSGELFTIASWTHYPYPGSKNWKEYRIVAEETNRKDWRGVERPPVLRLEERQKGMDWMELYRWHTRDLFVSDGCPYF